MPIASMLLAASLALASQPSETAPANPPVAFPHPLVTEVLFNVPRGEEGDANGDGKRSATGDEFVELVNPHDRPISLKGYRLIDGTTVGAAARSAKRAAGAGKRDAQGPSGAKRDNSGAKGGESDRKGGGATDAKDAESDDESAASTAKPANAPDDPSTEDAHFEFTFPELTLAPGEVVVVFNGFESAIAGDVGDGERAAGKHEKFGGAYVFSAGVTSQYAAFSNQHDVLQLLDPAEEAVETIRWDYREQESAGRNSSRPSSSKASPSKSGTSSAERKRGGSTSRGNQADRVLDKRAEEAAASIENLPRVVGGSAQRSALGGEFSSHLEIAGTPFSPGVVAMDKK
jgi:hypothetical protein